MEYKHAVTIHVGKKIPYSRERTYIFRTDESKILGYFMTRRSIDKWSFPIVQGEIDEYNDGGGGTIAWGDFNFFEDLRIQNIQEILIDGVSINEPIRKAAEEFSAEARFPLIYHVQFVFKDYRDWIFNWYPTTGTLSRQGATEKYSSMKKLGIFRNVTEALLECQKNVVQCTL